jgi:hypothetical protein
MQGGGTLVRSINFEIEGRRLLDWEGDWDGHQAGSGPLDERTPPSLGLRPSGPPAGGGQKHSTSQAVGQERTPPSLGPWPSGPPAGGGTKALHVASGGTAGTTKYEA